MSPEVLMVTFKDRRQVHWEQRIAFDVERHIEVLRIVQMKGFADKGSMESNRQKNEYCKISLHMASRMRLQFRVRASIFAGDVTLTVSSPRTVDKTQLNRVTSG